VRPAVRLVAAAAPADGRGHVNRALALAEALAGLGQVAELHLLRGALTPGEAARAARLDVRVVPASDGASTGVTVVDLPEPNAMPGLDPARLVVFDDRDIFSGRAAIVVQPSLPRWTGPGHADRILAGYDHIPLARRYRELREDPAALTAAAPPAGPGLPPLVLLCFGGSDPDLVTERLAPSLAAAGAGGDPGWRLGVVVGAGHRDPGGNDGAVERDPPDLPERLAAADLAIVGAGTMKFEVACLRRPAVLVGVADDQLTIGPPFAATGSAVWLGDGRTVDPALLVTTVERLLADRVALATMARRAGEVVDGRGADRLAEAVLRLARAA
jgi:spore coat polysaccharide biosynthesis predicted glycosyltransferase SpsG